MYIFIYFLNKDINNNHLFIMWVVGCGLQCCQWCLIKTTGKVALNKRFFSVLDPLTKYSAAIRGGNLAVLSHRIMQNNGAY